MAAFERRPSWLHFLSISLLLFIALSSMISSSYAQVASVKKQLLGVNPADMARYTADRRMFTCFDKSKTIPIMQVNDDYCDCADGSDEPGTSACSRGRFYCVNKGHAGEYIPSSRVNDGICDCCDGSDEYEGRTSCQNTCSVLGASKRKETQERIVAMQEGLRIKQEYIEKGTAELNKLREEQETLKNNIEIKRVQVENLGIEKKKQEQLQDLEKRILDSQRASEGTPSDTPVIVESTTEAAMAAPSELEQSLTEAEKQELKEAEEAAAAAAAPAEDDETKAAMERALAEELDKDHEAEKSGFVDRLSSYFTGAVRSTKLAYNKLLQRFYGHFDKSAADIIKQKHREAQDELMKMEMRNKEVEKILAHDFGKQGEFFALYEECFAQDTLEYTYEACLYGKATQKPKGSGSNANLGKFSSFADNYRKALFTEGGHCWQGPPRSLELKMECGAKEEVKGVEEPSRCVYSAIFYTPAACQQSELVALQKSLE